MKASPALSNPVLNTSLSDVCANGGYFCRRCQRFVDVQDSHSGYVQCAKCQSCKVKWCPPVPGFSRDRKS